MKSRDIFAAVLAAAMLTGCAKNAAVAPATAEPTAAPVQFSDETKAQAEQTVKNLMDAVITMRDADAYADEEVTAVAAQRIDNYLYAPVLSLIDGYPEVYGDKRDELKRLVDYEVSIGDTYEETGQISYIVDLNVCYVEDPEGEYSRAAITDVLGFSLSDTEAMQAAYSERTGMTAEEIAQSFPDAASFIKAFMLEFKPECEESFVKFIDNIAANCEKHDFRLRMMAQPQPDGSCRIVHADDVSG